MKFDGGDVLAIFSDGDQLASMGSIHSFNQEFRQQVLQSRAGKAATDIDRVFNGKTISWVRPIRTALSVSQEASA
jgi:hypothetical protein